MMKIFLKNEKRPKGGEPPAKMKKACQMAGEHQKARRKKPCQRAGEKREQQPTRRKDNLQ